MELKTSKEIYALCLPLKSFIRKVVEQAEHSAMLRQRQYDDRLFEKAVEQARAATLKEVVEMIEGMTNNGDKKELSYLDVVLTDPYQLLGYNSALSDLKQSITRLTEKK
jgi:hypothetical protein